MRFGNVIKLLTDTGKHIDKEINMEKIDDLYKLNCILVGAERENYDMWLEDASTVVKCNFAEHGYYPERLIHDESFDVRKAIIQYSSDYCAKYAHYLLDDKLNDNQYWG